MKFFHAALKFSMPAFSARESATCSDVYKRQDDMWDIAKEEFMERMTESAKAVVDHFGKHITYVNVMRNMSVSCDCEGTDAEPVVCLLYTSHICNSVIDRNYVGQFEESCLQNGVGSSGSQSYFFCY